MITCKICHHFKPSEYNPTGGMGGCSIVDNYKKSLGRPLTAAEYDAVDLATGVSIYGSNSVRLRYPWIERNCKKYRGK